MIYEPLPIASSNNMVPYCDADNNTICYGKWCDKILKFEAAPGMTIHTVVKYVLNQSTTYNRDAILTFNDVQLKIPKQTENKEETVRNIVKRYILKLKSEKRTRGN